MPANTSVFADLLSDFEAQYGANLIGVTVCRIRGQISMAGPATMTAGVRVYTESTFPTLTSAGQGVVNDQYADWMSWWPLLNDDVAGELTLREVDSKSMRKIDEIGQGLLLSVGTTEATAGLFNADLSIGLKLP